MVRYARSMASKKAEGTVVRAAGGGRFVVKVDFIQRGAAVELDDALLSRLDVC